MEKGYFYFLSNKTRKLLYAEATVNLRERLRLHEKGKGAVFTKKYHVKYLVYFETFDNAKDALKPEKQVKNRKRDWKWELIKRTNTDFLDLKNELTKY